MATRFYLPSTGGADISPAYDGAWDVESSSGLERLKCVLGKTASPMADKSHSGSGSVAEIAFDAASSSQATDSSLTWEHTCSGDNRILVVGVSCYLTATVSAVTYNGVALTKAGSVYNAGIGTTEIWYLVAPAIGTHDVVVTVTISSYIVGGATSWTGANQSAPIGTFASATGIGTTATVDITSAAGEIVVDALSAYQVTATVGVGQTERWNLYQGNLRGTGSHEAGATTVTMSWTLSLSNKAWAIAGLPIKPATLDQDAIFWQYASDPIAAQTITAQTVKLQVRGCEHLSDSDGYVAVGIRVVSNDGGVVRGTILAVARDDTELSTTYGKNRRFYATSSQVVSQEGDRIVIEIGAGGNPFPAPYWYLLIAGDDASIDLPEDDIELNAYNPWVEFTQSLGFIGGQSYSRTLIDTLTPVAIMAPYRTSIRTLTDLLDVSGVLNRGRFLELSDNLDLSDSLTRIITRVLELLDTLDVTVAHLGYPRFQQPEDLINLIESFSIGRFKGQTLTDTLTLSDSMMGSVSHLLTDLLTVSDTITKGTSAGKAEVLSLSEVITKGTYEGLTDSVTLADVITKDSHKFLSDVLVLLDALQKAITAILPTETMTLSDAIMGRSKTLNLADTLTLADTITKAATHFLADILSLQDVLLGVPRPVLELQVRLRGHLTIQQSFGTYRTIRIQFRGGGEE